jgi:hypothetical protein
MAWVRAVALHGHRLTGVQIQDHNSFQYLATFPNSVMKQAALQVFPGSAVLSSLFYRDLATLPKARTDLATFPHYLGWNWQRFQTHS